MSQSKIQTRIPLIQRTIKTWQINARILRLDIQVWHQNLRAKMDKIWTTIVSE